MRAIRVRGTVRSGVRPMRLAVALVLALAGCAKVDPAAVDTSWRYEYLDAANAVIDSAIARQEVVIADLLTFNPDSLRCFRVVRPIVLLHNRGETFSLLAIGGGERIWARGTFSAGDTVCSWTESQ